MRDILRLSLSPLSVGSIAREFTLGRLTIQVGSPVNLVLWWRTSEPAR